MTGHRIYPASRVATVLVWFLDRLPESIRGAVLSAYWSPEDIRQMDDTASELEEFFGSEGQE
jgi:hypothetical protein